MVFQIMWSGMHFTVDTDTLLFSDLASIFTRSFVVVLGVQFHNCTNVFQGTFVSGTQKPSIFLRCIMSVCSYFILAYDCLNRWMWFRQTSGNCTRERTKAMRVHNTGYLNTSTPFTHHVPQNMMCTGAALILIRRFVDLCLSGLPHASGFHQLCQEKSTGSPLP